MCCLKRGVVRAGTRDPPPYGARRGWNKNVRWHLCTPSLFRIEVDLRGLPRQIKREREHTTPLAQKKHHRRQHSTTTYTRPTRLQSLVRTCMIYIDDCAGGNLVTHFARRDPQYTIRIAPCHLPGLPQARPQSRADEENDQRWLPIVFLVVARFTRRHV